jgi:hypothetical protein
MTQPYRAADITINVVGHTATFRFLPDTTLYHSKGADIGAGHLSDADALAMALFIHDVVPGHQFTLYSEREIMGLIDMISNSLVGAAINLIPGSSVGEILKNISVEFLVADLHGAKAPPPPPIDDSYSIEKRTISHTSGHQSILYQPHSKAVLISDNGWIENDRIYFSPWNEGDPTSLADLIQERDERLSLVLGDLNTNAFRVGFSSVTIPSSSKTNQRGTTTTTELFAVRKWDEEPGTP